ncbi:MAG: aminotransferase class I/II-fold pyridoxal phosphate-dependent enzyme [Bacteroidales bacterium]|jgi:aspartate/methionine/tyrosine aminotransferase|nr:aminotransferase class I/II-fold pyridoxal phosphate-dependent enzyme [Bacteroidales bacterium]
MNPQAEELNLIIREKSSAVFEMLSQRGKAIYFPKKGILAQSAEAGKAGINATIGMAVEDNGSPMRLESIASRVDLKPEKIFLYAPSFGRPEIRAEWKKMIYKKNPSIGNAEISLPIVTNALTHGISMAGYMFCDPADQVIVPDLFWENYTLTFTNAYGSPLKPYKLFKNDGLDLAAFETALEEGVTGKKIVLLNFPNNPAGYTPTQTEQKSLVRILKASAEKGNKIVVLIDDAYFGLCYEDGIARESIFSSLCSAHENILAVKLDGPTKEDYVWGFRVGFITYGIKGGDAAIYGALESKTAGAIRGNISNAANISQSLLLEAYSHPEYETQKTAKYEIMKSRYCEVKQVLKNETYESYFKALPFNSGYFMCIELAEGLDGEKIRKLLIEKYSIGVIAFDNLLRIAFSGVAKSNIKPLFEGIYEACKEMSTK